MKLCTSRLSGLPGPPVMSVKPSKCWRSKYTIAEILSCSVGCRSPVVRMPQVCSSPMFFTVPTTGPVAIPRVPALVKVRSMNPPMSLYQKAVRTAATP